MSEFWPRVGQQRRCQAKHDSSASSWRNLAVWLWLASIRLIIWAFLHQQGPWDGGATSCFAANHQQLRVYQSALTANEPFEGLCLIRMWAVTQRLSVVLT